MNIVHFSSGRVNPNAAKVGSVNMIYWLADAQARAGHKVSIVVCPEKRDYENARSDSIEIREYPYSRLAGLFVERQLLADIKRGALTIDIAHIHGVWNMQAAAIGSALHKRGIPYVVSSHGSFAPGIRHRQALRKWGFRVLFGLPLVNNSAFVHIHSQDEAKDARDYGVRAPLVVAEQGFNEESIPPGLDRDWLAKRFPEHRNSFKMLFLGRLDPWHKGIDRLLEAVALARGRAANIVLFLIGPKKRRYSSEIPKLIAKLGLMDRVVLVGPLYDPQEKYSALTSADLFVLTSRFEGFPLTVLEAMACGVPVLVTRETNAGSMVADRQAGIVCEGRAEEIADAIVKAASTPDALRAMAGRGVELIKTQTWERTAALLLDEYETRLKGDVE